MGILKIKKREFGGKQWKLRVEIAAWKSTKLIFEKRRGNIPGCGRQTKRIFRRTISKRI